MAANENLLFLAANCSSDRCTQLGGSAYLLQTQKVLARNKGIYHDQVEWSVAGTNSVPLP